jgi:hypothetical protein
MQSSLQHWLDNRLPLRWRRLEDVQPLLDTAVFFINYLCASAHKCRVCTVWHWVESSLCKSDTRLYDSMLKV